MIISGRIRVLSTAAALVLMSLTTPSGTALAETPTPSIASGFSPAGLDKIGAYFDNEVATDKIPGAIVLIQRHGKPVYFKSFGVRDVATKLPMSPDTIFRVFSMSKPITAVTTMMLIDQGKLKLDDPLSKYIPAFADVKVGVEVKGDDGAPKLDLVVPDRPITIQDMLRQSSGITYGFYGDSLVRKAYKAADLFRNPLDNTVFAERIAKLPLEVQPGAIWDYGHSMDVMGRVIEVVSGKSLYQTEKALLFDPLGMTDTAFYVSEPDKFPLIAEPLPNDKTFVAAMERDIHVPTTWEAGGSGMVSTITDYAKFAQMLLNGGSLDGKRYLSEASFKAMTSNQLFPVSQVRKGPFYFPGDGFGYGYGFGVRVEPGDNNPPGSIGEFKWDGAGGTYFFVDPKNDMFVVFMVQTPSQRGRIQRDLKKMIYDALEP